MKIWKETTLFIEGYERKAIAPVIISASRATDIPAYYGAWLVDKFKRGYLVKRNPFNGKASYISLREVRVIVFWTKNAKPFMKYLSFFDDLGINYYFLYTLNDYPQYEPHLPSLDRRIENFIELSSKLGRKRVLWRFDPIIISEQVSKQAVLDKIENIGNQIHKYTTRLIFSFVDISYRKVQNTLKRNGFKFFILNKEAQIQIVKKLAGLSKKWKIDLRSCASNIDFTEFGALPNKCIDDELMVELWKGDKKLMDFLGYNGKGKYISNPKLKDKGQRKNCLCIYSKDIGRYNTCPTGCVYCYANSSYKIALKNYKSHNIESLEL